MDIALVTGHTNGINESISIGNYEYDAISSYNRIHEFEEGGTSNRDLDYDKDQSQKYMQWTWWTW